MRLRLALTLLILAGPVAFAPAPFPKKARHGTEPEISLKSLQGTWRLAAIVRTRGNGEVGPEPCDCTHVRVVNDRWSFLEKGMEVSSLYIAINHTRKPAHFTFYGDRDKKRVFSVGLVRRHQGKVQVLYDWRGEAEPPLTFESAPEGFLIVILEK